MQCVWRRKSPLVAFIFVLQRYCAMLDPILTLTLGKPWTRKTLRIWAVWEKAVLPTLLVLLTSAIVPAVNLYEFAQSRTITFLLDGTCELDPSTTNKLAFAALAINCSVLLLDIYQPPFSGSSSFLKIGVALTANLLARFILDLRSLADRYEERLPTTIPIMSSIQFGDYPMTDQSDVPDEDITRTWGLSHLASDDVSQPSAEISCAQRDLIS
ncbi:hypothetical protein EIP91_003867 [Steccherinum ochraceum]|uniref:Uncharacterized protein n=1 Tax=Steccherinum ochraceum TaxID=92696 RepID=A0A4R0RB40_9APHY|nr:hypothetical protein EIP91_003867 [Steccherinum ochraceum]